MIAQAELLHLYELYVSTRLSLSLAETSNNYTVLAVINFALQFLMKFVRPLPRCVHMKIDEIAKSSLICG